MDFFVGVVFRCLPLFFTLALRCLRVLQPGKHEDRDDLNASLSDSSIVDENELIVDVLVVNNELKDDEKRAESDGSGI